MNQIQQLINQMCPNGVEYQPLWTLTAWDKHFNGVDKNMQKKVIPYKYYLSEEFNAVEKEDGDILYIATGVSDKKRFTTEDLASDYIAEGEIVCIPWGGTPNVKYYKGKFVTGDNRIATSLDTNVLNNKFLYYWMCNRIKDISLLYRGAGIKHPSMKGVLSLQIPVPPLAIQTRIVEILDHFTNLTANLTAELNLRRKQFEHYREKLLSLDGVEMVKLFDVAKNSTGLTYKPSDVSDSGTLVLRSSNIQNSMLCFDDNVFVKMKSIPTRALVKENDILVCVRNGSSTLIGKAAIIDKSCEGMAFGAFMTILRAFNINYKYLFYVWQSDRIQKMVHGDSGAPINQITNAVLDKIMIPYPSEDTQHSIVSILDKFTALIENIEKELALRQKQYEYYREELLRFGG